MRTPRLLLSAFSGILEHRRDRGPRRWRVVSAVHGRGTLLIGPLLRQKTIAGAWVIAPPGVRLETPPGDPDGPPLSVFGWREALWTPDASGDIAIDRSRPDHLNTCQLSEVLELVRTECPEHLGWVTDQLTNCVTTLHLLTREDASARRSPSGRLAHRTLRAFVEDSEEALASFQPRGPGSDTAPRAGMLRDLCADLDEQAVPTTDR